MQFLLELDFILLILLIHITFEKFQDFQLVIKTTNVVVSMNRQNDLSTIFMIMKRTKSLNLYKVMMQESFEFKWVRGFRLEKYREKRWRNRSPLSKMKHGKCSTILLIYDIRLPTMTDAFHIDELYQPHKRKRCVTLDLLMVEIRGFPGSQSPSLRSSFWWEGKFCAFTILHTHHICPSWTTFYYQTRNWKS